MTQLETKDDGGLVGPWRTPVNISADAEGSIHNDETAQELGLEGGWIAGSIHMEQFAPLMAQTFGADWLRSGTLSFYFRKATLSGEAVRCFAEPPNADTGFSNLRMENKAGDLISEGVAFVGEPRETTPLRQRLASSPQSDAIKILKDIKVGASAKDVPARIEKDRFDRDLPGVTEQLPEYAEHGALPPNLSIDALATVQKVMAPLPEGAVGLYGGIELQMVDGPILAATNYLASGKVLAMGKTPRTETIWFESELTRPSDRSVVARMLMLSRVMA
jgi:hypothetical protein